MLVFIRAVSPWTHAPCLSLRQYFPIILYITRGQQWMESDRIRYGCWHGCPSHASTQTAHIKSVLIFRSACGLLNWLYSTVSQPLSPSLSSILFTPSLGLAGIWRRGLGVRLRALVAARRHGRCCTSTQQPAGVNSADQYCQYSWTLSPLKVKVVS